MSAKYDALYDMYVNSFGEDHNLVYGNKIIRKFMELNKIIAIDAIENGVIFTFNSIDGCISNIICETNKEAELEFIEVGEID